MNTKKLNLKNIGEIDNGDKYNYIQTLLNPEKYGGIKAPSKKRVPTVTLQLKTNAILTTDINGQVVLKVTPFFLIDNDIINYNMPYTYITRQGQMDNYFNIKNLGVSYTYGYYDGSDENDKYTIMDQKVPSCLYTYYRLVSASLYVKYIGSIKEASGLVGGGISYEEVDPVLSFGVISNSPGVEEVVSSFVPAISTEEMIDNIRHMQYTRENRCLEGIRMLYYPVDNSYLDFVPLPDKNNLQYKERGLDADTDAPYIEVDKMYYKKGFNWYAYVDGGKPESKNYMIELCCNYECIVNPKMLLYVIPTENNFIMPEEELGKLIEEIKRKSLNKLI